MENREHRITARLSDDEIRVLDRAARVLGADRSKIIRLALNSFFGQMVLYNALELSNEETIVDGGEQVV